MKIILLTLGLISVCIIGLYIPRASNQNSTNKQTPNLTQPTSTQSAHQSKNSLYSLSLSDWISITASLATLITAILTYLLLRETQKTLKLSVNIFDREEKRSEAETMNLLHQNFQNTYSAMLNDVDTLKILSDAENITAAEVKINFYSSFLINNANQLFTYRQRKFVPDSEWNNLVGDMIAFFEYPFIRHRWQIIKKYYPQDFRDFIETSIIITES